MSAVRPSSKEAARSASTANTPTPIRLDRVSKWYGYVIGANDVSLAVEPGIVALLGPNGAGKSTLMKLITGQLRPSMGQVRVFGLPPANASARRRVGYCPDVDAFYEEMTGRNFVLSLLKLAGYRSDEAEERTERSLATVGMADRAGKILRGFSKGMRQRIKLAQAIAHDPDLLVLDEPLSGLDPVGRREFCNLFRQWAEEGRTLLVSSHVMEEIESIAESVILVGGGRVLTQGSWKDLNSFLNDIPQRFRITVDRARDLVSELVRWPGVVEVTHLGDNDCTVTTRDAGGLCDQVSDIVRRSGLRIERLSQETNWAESLFGIAREA
jgi:ABC-2 type transport system ATP-binding protein